jgi:hypothetical protein
MTTGWKGVNHQEVDRVIPRNTSSLNASCVTQRMVNVSELGSSCVPHLKPSALTWLLRCGVVEQLGPSCARTWHVCHGAVCVMVMHELASGDLAELPGSAKLQVCTKPAPLCHTAVARMLNGMHNVCDGDSANAENVRAVVPPASLYVRVLYKGLGLCTCAASWHPMCGCAWI